MASPPHCTIPRSPLSLYPELAPTMIVPSTLPGRVHIRLGMSRPGTACSVIWLGWQPASTNKERRWRTRSWGSSGLSFNFSWRTGRYSRRYWMVCPCPKQAADSPQTRKPDARARSTRETRVITCSSKPPESLPRINLGLNPLSVSSSRIYTTLHRIVALIFVISSAARDLLSFTEAHSSLVGTSSD